MVRGRHLIVDRDVVTPTNSGGAGGVRPTPTGGVPIKSPEQGGRLCCHLTNTGAVPGSIEARGDVGDSEVVGASGNK